MLLTITHHWFNSYAAMWEQVVLCILACVLLVGSGQQWEVMTSCGVSFTLRKLLLLLLMVWWSLPKWWEAKQGGSQWTIGRKMLNKHGPTERTTTELFLAVWALKLGRKIQGSATFTCTLRERERESHIQTKTSNQKAFMNLMCFNYSVCKNLNMLWSSSSWLGHNDQQYLRGISPVFLRHTVWTLAKEM